MPAEDKPVEVLNVFPRIETSPSEAAIPVEMGAQGNVVELIAIHYSLPDVSIIDNFRCMMVLSSNPNHLLNPPAGRFLNSSTPGLYGAGYLVGNFMSNGINYAVSEVIKTLIIPLYGLMRPRRQVLIVSMTCVHAPMTCHVEIYYRPVSLSNELENSINRKFGKFKRS